MGVIAKGIPRGCQGSIRTLLSKTPGESVTVSSGELANCELGKGQIDLFKGMDKSSSKGAEHCGDSTSYFNLYYTQQRGQ